MLQLIPISLAFGWNDLTPNHSYMLPAFSVKTLMSAVRDFINDKEKPATLEIKPISYIDVSVDETNSFVIISKAVLEAYGTDAVSYKVFKKSSTFQ